MKNLGVEILNAENFPGRARSLSSRFPELSAIVDAHGLPDFWHRPPRFETLVLIILEQQVSLLSAEQAYGRMVAGLGTVNSELVESATIDGLRELGITRQKSRYIFELARSIRTGELNLKRLENESDGVVFENLTRLPGIGPWTAKVYLLAALCRPDVWPPGDLALIKTIRKLLPDGNEEWERTGERWAPERAVAARLIWHEYLS